MQPYIPNLRAIEVKYYGPTDTRGARVRLRDLRGILPTRWISYDYAHGSAADTAREFLESEGWTLAHGAETPDAFLWLSPDLCIGRSAGESNSNVMGICATVG